MMKPEDLTIEELERALDMSADQWHGKCTLIAHYACKLVGGHEIYGSYLGPVHKDGYWGNRRMLPNNHGWVLLDDGRVLDPTRWSFEHKDPYIYIGKNDDDYDEGGNKMRAAFRSPCPSADQGRPANLKEVLCSAPLFEQLTNTPFDKITIEQAAWVANTPYDELDFAVAPIYETLIQNEMDAYIPIDNLRRAQREGRIKCDD